MMALDRIFWRKHGNYSKLRVSCDRDSMWEVKIGGLRYELVDTTKAERLEGSDLLCALLF